MRLLVSGSGAYAVVGRFMEWLGVCVGSLIAFAAGGASVALQVPPYPL